MSSRNTEINSAQASSELIQLRKLKFTISLKWGRLVLTARLIER